MTSRPIMIRAEAVSKRFGGQIAVDQVSYLLQEHEIAGIIGSNGAGKTTFFNLLTGYYRPDEGTIRYLGEDVTNMRVEQRVARGMMRTFQLASTFDNMPVLDNLVLAYFRAYRKSGLLQLLTQSRRSCYREPAVLQALDTFELLHLRDRHVKHLSLGEKRRLEIAMAIIAEPQVLLLDEPLAGLAVSEIRTILDVLRRHAGRQTILIVEHKLSHVQEFVERFTVMHEGRVIADGNYDDVISHPDVRRSYWQIQTPADTGGAA